MCRCERCLVKIDINEAYFGQINESELSMDYYCPDCWESMWVCSSKEDEK